MKKQRVFSIIQIGNRDDIPSKTFDFFIVIVIVLNILVLILSTFEQFASWEGIFDSIETFTIAVFVVEYALRLWTSDLLYPNLAKGKAALRFIFSFDGIVMLLSILPFYFLSGFVIFRMLRIVRVFHLFRLNATTDSFNVIAQVLYDKRNQLLSSILVIFILILSSALCMYSVEHDAQPELYKNAFSGIWWSLSTIFTVGYGDIYPITPLGRTMTVVITILGVLGVAIPTGIISAGFVEYDSRIRNKGLPDPTTKNTVSFIIEEDSPHIGQTIDEIERTYAVTVAAIVRDGMIILPTDAVRILGKDMLIYQASTVTDRLNVPLSGSDGA